MKEGVSVCALCGRDLHGSSLYCSHCDSTFHRACILHHFYYHRFCPSCGRRLSFVDLRPGEPPRPPQHLIDVDVEVTPFTREVPLRRPRWPVQEEVPLFKIVPAYRYRYRARKGMFARIRGFILAEPEEVSSTLGRFRQNRKAMAGVFMLVMAVVVAVLAPVLILYDPVSYLAEDETYVNHPPTLKYPLGTDVFGRDIYSQTVWGFRSALLLALPSALLIGGIGTVVGLVSGYYGKYVDAVLQRVSLAFLVWPSVPLVALIVFSWGGSQTQLAVIAGVAFSLWPTTARAIRAEVMSLKGRAFIEAAKVSGASSMRIVFRHILPNVVHITFLYITIGVASALVLEATFNFLGLSSPAVITWGQMLSFSYHAATARYGVGGGISWWAVLPPGLAIASMVLSFFFISTGLRESMKMSVQF